MNFPKYDEQMVKEQVALRTKVGIQLGKITDAKLAEAYAAGWFSGAKTIYDMLKRQFEMENSIRNDGAN